MTVAISITLFVVSAVTIVFVLYELRVAPLDERLTLEEQQLKDRLNEQSKTN